MTAKKKDRKIEFLGFGVNTEFQFELVDSDDRATGLIGAIGIETLLDRLLRTCFIDSKKEVDSLLSSNNSNAPLNSFYSKIKASYCLGLLSKMEYEDIQKIRDIRNIFAHHLYDCTFEQEDIKNICKNFWAVKLNMLEKNTSKSNFITTIYLSEMAIKERIKNQKHLVSPRNIYLKNN